MAKDIQNSITFTFICGDDDYLVIQEARKFFEEKTKKLSDSFSQEIILARANNVGEVEACIRNFCQAVQTRSLFGDKKVVWLKDINFLEDSITGRAEGTKAQLEILQNCLLELDSTAVDVILSAYPIDRRRKEYKWFEQHGKCIVLSDSKDPEQLKILAKKEAAAYNIKINEDALELLLAKINNSPRLVIEEIHKLATYIGLENKPIDEALVQALVPEFGESNFFETADTFYCKNLNQILESISKYFFHNKEARPLLAALQNRNRLLLQLKALLDSGKVARGGFSITKDSLSAWQKEYGAYSSNTAEKSSFCIYTQNPWYLSKLAATAKSFDLKTLIQYQLEFVKTFSKLISNYNEQEKVMRELAMRCCFLESKQ